MKKNYYNILEISPQATTEQVKMAVVQLGRKYAAKAQKNKVARTKLDDIQQAYKVLSHPQRRKYHDEDLAEQNLNTPQPVEQKQPSQTITAKRDKLRELTKLFLNSRPIAEQSLNTPKPVEQKQPSQTVTTKWSKLQELTKLFLNSKSIAQQNLNTPQPIKHNQSSQPIAAKQDKLRELTKLPLNSRQIEAKKNSYGLFSDETILFYSKPHFLSCLDIAALTLIILSSYLYITDPLKDYMPMVTLWLPSQLSTVLPQLSLWKLGMGTMLIMGIAIELEVIVNKFSTELLLTQNRIITKTGALGNKKIEIKLNAMESVSIQQSLLGRLFNYGAMIITGTGQGKVVLRNIAAPHKMSHLIWFHIKAKKE
ncbi:PH domain-containing protein [Candidatus Albibeggiatoa sp. nov. BB20]|uniref:PH domain-containing protein n=1 Tax=Candidatus Albibeggiatoa sp. nov. BB20 TaxID=3162723 RepID=UPI00336539BE